MVECRLCLDRRIRAWEETRKRNGLTEAEWPKPQAPQFADQEALQAHLARQHRVPSI